MVLVRSIQNIRNAHQPNEVDIVKNVTKRTATPTSNLGNKNKKIRIASAISAQLRGNFEYKFLKKSMNGHLFNAVACLMQRLVDNAILRLIFRRLPALERRRHRRRL